MKQYQQCLQHIIDHGQIVNDRTGVGTLSTFGYQMRYDLTAVSYTHLRAHET